jgi:GT2 family glycosyltransferase
MIKYQVPSGVTSSKHHGRIVLNTEQGGEVVIDENILYLWQKAQGKTLEQILDEERSLLGDVVRTGVACLVEGGFLVREGFEAEIKIFSRKEGAKVSIIIISYNSVKWLSELIPSLLNQTYSPIEIIIVDNGSDDHTVTWVNKNYPEIIVKVLKKNVSFAKANNIGIKEATGDYIFLINPDTYLEPDTIAEMVKVESATPEDVIVAGKLRFWWAPSFINGIGNRVGSFSWGTDNALGYLDFGQFDVWTELPSACFAAVLIPKRLFDTVGKIDEKFPMYYEDSEWCYRARMFGYKVIPAHNAIIYHAFGGIVPNTETENRLTPIKLQNVAYGRYRFALLINSQYLFRFIRNYLLEDLINILRLIFRRDVKSVASYFQAWLKLINDRSEIRSNRKDYQSQRVIDDIELYRIQKQMPPTMVWRGLPELTWDLVKNYYHKIIIKKVNKIPEFDKKHHRPHLLIVSNDIVDKKMAGPGMRYFEMARILSKDFSVTLAIPNKTEVDIPDANIVQYKEEHPNELRILTQYCDVALFSSHIAGKCPFLSQVDQRIIIDLYDPIVLENLHYYLNETSSSQQLLNQQSVELINNLVKIGDFFICGNERQRDYWLGVLTANGRINPESYKHDPTMRSLIDIVGIGLPEHKPDQTPFLHGIHPNIPKDAKIVLWGGGIWNWLDPLTIIEAWPQIITQNPSARLVFLGTRHPNPTVPRHEMVNKAEKLAEEIGEKDKSITFLDWVPYKDRERILSESDLSVTLHPIHVETRFSLRTRVLDAIWAGIPLVVTEGDITSEWIKKYNIGIVCSEFDKKSVADAINQILNSPKPIWETGFTELQNKLKWEKVVEPLRAYVLGGTKAPDRNKNNNQIHIPIHKNFRLKLAKALFLFKNEGLHVLLHRIWRYIQWQLS